MLSINEMFIENRLRLLLTVVFLLIGILAGVDIVADIREGTDLAHVLAELLVFVIAIVSALVILLRLLNEVRASRLLLADMQKKIERHQAEALEWQNETRVLLQGLGVSINRQFERWQLSHAEKEVALFLLKGLSHKEIAIIRNVSEATARQQARAVYQKARVTGRNELAAFFLEELALPVENKKDGLADA